ncbi:hypothetical protein [Sphingomonas cavernae]|nr:hypothetical protein [Sphingomonas cavernae]
MVISTPEHVVSFEQDAQSRPTLEQAREKGRAYLDNAIHAAQEHPWAAAAIGAGVVATVAATAYGATRLAARRGNGEVESDAMIDPDVLPEALPLE